MRSFCLLRSFFRIYHQLIVKTTKNNNIPACVQVILLGVWCDLRRGNWREKKEKAERTLAGRYEGHARDEVEDGVSQDVAIRFDTSVCNENRLPLPETWSGLL